MNVPQLILSFWLTIAHQEKINWGRYLRYENFCPKMKFVSYLRTGIHTFLIHHYSTFFE